MTDAAQYRDEALQRPVPTLILHGLQDAVVPIAASHTYAATRPWVQVQPLDSDHSLGNVLPEIWQAIAPYGSPTQTISKPMRGSCKLMRRADCSSTLHPNNQPDKCAQQAAWVAFRNSLTSG